MMKRDESWGGMGRLEEERRVIERGFGLTRKREGGICGGGLLGGANFCVYGLGWILGEGGCRRSEWPAMPGFH